MVGSFAPKSCLCSLYVYVCYDICLHVFWVPIFGMCSLFVILYVDNSMLCRYMCIRFTTTIRATAIDIFYAGVDVLDDGRRRTTRPPRSILRYIEHMNKPRLVSKLIFFNFFEFFHGISKRGGTETTTTATTTNRFDFII
jgi:hypothetical protein